MSVNLYYDTIQPVQQAAALQIVAEATALVTKRDWWCEPLMLHVTPSGAISGSTKMILGGYSLDDGGFVEVIDNEEWLMVWSDTTFIIATLSEWSEKYHVDWKLNTEGTPVGKIHNGQPDNELEGFINSLRSSSDLPDEQVSAVSQKYASRNEPLPPAPKPSAPVASPPQTASFPSSKKPWWKLW